MHSFLTRPVIRPAALASPAAPPFPCSSGGGVGLWTAKGVIISGLEFKDSVSPWPSFFDRLLSSFVSFLKFKTN